MMPRLKVDLRVQYLLKRRNLESSTVFDNSALIVRRIRESGLLTGIKNISSYKARDNEPDLSGLEGLMESVRFYFPAVTGKAKMDFYHCSSKTGFHAGYKGILEPEKENDNLLKPGCGTQRTAFLVPGVLFSRDGQRIGSGGGFYDRYFSGIPERKHVVLIGIAHDIQISDETWEVDDTDVKMDFVITEKKIYNAEET